MKSESTINNWNSTPRLSQQNKTTKQKNTVNQRKFRYFKWKVLTKSNTYDQNFMSSLLCFYCPMLRGGSERSKWFLVQIVKGDTSTDWARWSGVKRSNGIILFHSTFKSTLRGWAFLNIQHPYVWNQISMSLRLSKSSVQNKMFSVHQVWIWSFHISIAPNF